MPIDENIKKLREYNNITQTELGLIAGVTDKAVSTWELGTNEPRMGAIQKIADHFNISKSDLIEDGGIDKVYNKKASDGSTLSLGSYIKKYRSVHDLTLEEFAAKSGMSVDYVSKLETGIDPVTKDAVLPTLKTYGLIAQATNTDLSHLITILDDNQPVVLYENQEQIKTRKIIAKNIRKLREKNNMSRAEFGRIAGVSEKAIFTWEQGTKKPRMATLQKIADFFGISKTDIMEEGGLDKIWQKPEDHNAPFALSYSVNGNYYNEYLPPEWQQDGNHYHAIVVHGDSMYPRYIENDIAVIQLQKDFVSGQDCALYLNNDELPTIKTLYKNPDGTITLKPANPEWLPKTVSAKDIQILGVVRRLRRDFGI